MRILGAVLGALAVSTLLGCSADSTRSGGMGVETVRLTVTQAAPFRFRPAKHHVRRGGKIRVVLENQTDIPHNAEIRELGVKTRVITYGVVESTEVTIPSGGVFEVICGVPGHLAAGMRAEIDRS